MESLVSMIVNDESATDISNKIKEILYAKSAEKIEEIKPYVASSFFGDSEEQKEE